MRQSVSAKSDSPASFRPFGRRRPTPGVAWDKAGNDAGHGVDRNGHAARFRVQRLKYAVVTALLSKGGTALLQLLAIPIAIRTLGVQGYALFAGISAVVGWLNLGSISVGPAFVVQMAAAAAREDPPAQRRLFTSVFFPVVVNVIVLSAGVLALMSWYPMTRLFNSEFAGLEHTIYAGLWMMGTMQLIQPLFAVVEAAQAGYQEQYLLNLRGVLGNAGSLALLMLIPRWPTVIYMVIAMQGPQFLSRLTNSLWFFLKRAFLLPRPASFRWRDCRSLVGDGLWFSLASTASAYLSQQFPVMILERALGANASALFAAGMSLAVMAIGVVSMICIPLWPALADSLSRGDAVWARGACRRLLTLCTAYGAVIGLALALFGKAIFRAWLGDALHPSDLYFVFLGIYLLLLVWEYVHYMMLVALRGVGLPSVLSVARAGISVALIFWLIRGGADYAAFAGLCLSTAAFTGIVFPWLLHQSLAAVPIGEKVHR